MTSLPMPEKREPDPLGWHVISGTFLLETLRRCTAGEDADLVFAELWANADISKTEGGSL